MGIEWMKRTREFSELRISQIRQVASTSFFFYNIIQKTEKKYRIHSNFCYTMKLCTGNSFTILRGYCVKQIVIVIIIKISVYNRLYNNIKQCHQRCSISMNNQTWFFFLLFKSRKRNKSLLILKWQIFESFQYSEIRIFCLNKICANISSITNDDETENSKKH